MAVIATGHRVNVTRLFSDGGTTTNEVIVYCSGCTQNMVEARARDAVTQLLSIPSDLEQRRVTEITFTYVGQA